MQENEEKKLLDKMKDLLLRGARMLGDSCPKCGTPLFYVKAVGLKYCPKCDVYLATPEELEKAKIDKTKLKILDFNEYWSKKEQIQTPQEELTKPPEKMPAEPKPKITPKEKVSIEVNKLSDAINELIIVLIEKLILLIDREYEKLNVRDMIEILKELIKVKKEVASGV